jgi:hypothetical protein
MITSGGSRSVKDVIHVRASVKNISVAAQEFQGLAISGLAAASGSRNNGRVSTGARVTVEFTLRTPIPPNCIVAVSYDLAGNGSWRECRGMPSHTHSTALSEGVGVTHHYRLAQWIAAAHVMRIERIEDADIAA